MYHLYHELAASVAECVCKRVWGALGSGHHESIYQNALALGVAKSFNIVRREVVVPVYFEGHCVGVGYADLVAGDDEDRLVIEVKTLKSKLSDQHRAQLRAYLRGLGLEWGVLVNFPERDTADMEFELVPL